MILLPLPSSASSAWVVIIVSDLADMSLVVADCEGAARAKRRMLAAK